MSLIDRYITRLILWPLGVTVSISIMLLLLDNMLRLFRYAISLGGPLRVIWEMLASLLPEYLSLGLTIGIFLSISLAFRRFALQNELDMVTNSGISERRLLKMPYLIAAIICVINFALVGFIEPRGERAFQLLYRDLAAGILGFTINAGEFTRVGENFIMRVEDIRNGPNDLRGIFFSRTDPKGETWVGTSPRGRIILDDLQKIPILRLSHGMLFRSGTLKTNPATLKFDNLDVDIKMKKTGQLLAPHVKMTSYTLPELWSISHDPETSTALRQSAIAKFYRRLVQAIFCLFLPPIAMLFAIPPKRISTPYGIIVALVLVIAFMKFADTAEFMAASGRTTALLAQSIPLSVLGMLSLWSYYQLTQQRGLIVGSIDRFVTTTIDAATSLAQWVRNSLLSLFYATRSR
ncbi:LptF/LptG family permease [Govanella unica]|uniref:LptF/LptG family permease n=1 Tax=Govanella unica TaxID=2975056 RepID=A0A9X3TZB3_9PROT|nr:LptF/LptG family permease [Govania unica]MDA5194182.1 LptF/LptG family permease [Govania unica]